MRSRPTPFRAADLDRLLATLRVLLAAPFHAVILSDYQKGTLPEVVCQALIAEARRQGVPDPGRPQGAGFPQISPCDHAYPQPPRVRSAVALEAGTESAFREAGPASANRLGLDFLVVTRGEKGISLFDDRGTHDFPAVAREVFDVSGAGDTVIATLAAGLVSGLDLDDALRLANLAAGIVVGKVGTTPIRRDELLAALETDLAATQSPKVCTLETLLEHVARWRPGRADRLHQRLLRPPPRRPRHPAGACPARGPQAHRRPQH